MPSSTTTNYLAQKQLDLLLKNISWTPPTTLWVGLFTTMPSLDLATPGVEVSPTGTAYGRTQILPANWVGPVGSSVEYSNGIDLAFAEPTADWGTVVGSGLFDAQTGGNLLYIATLSAGKAVVVGDGAPRILIGQLRISRASC